MVCCVEEPSLLDIMPVSVFLSIEEVQSATLGAGWQLGEPRFPGYRSPSHGIRHREPPSIPECHVTESDGIIEELSTLVFT